VESPGFDAMDRNRATAFLVDAGDSQTADVIRGGDVLLEENSQRLGSKGGDGCSSESFG
jgi:hypothetical protein